VLDDVLGAGLGRVYNGNEPPASIEDTPAFLTFPVPPTGAALAEVEYRIHSYALTYRLLMRLYLPNVANREQYARLIPFVSATITALNQTVTLDGVVTMTSVETFTIGTALYAGAEFLALDMILKVRETHPENFAP
jgi:hypothetical protein